MIGAIIAKKKAYKVFEARNRGDIDSFIENWDENVVYIHPGTSSFAGTFHGKETARKWFHRFREAFPSLKFEINNVFVKNPWALGATNTLAVEWALEITSYDEKFRGQNSGVTIVKLKKGKAIKVIDYIFNLQDPFHSESYITEKFPFNAY